MPLRTKGDLLDGWTNRQTYGWTTGLKGVRYIIDLLNFHHVRINHTQKLFKLVCKANRIYHGWYGHRQNPADHEMQNHGHASTLYLKIARFTQEMRGRGYLSKSVIWCTKHDGIQSLLYIFVGSLNLLPVSGVTLTLQF